MKIPGRSLFERRSNHYLRRIKLDQFAVQINSSPTGYSVFIDGNKIRIRDRTGPVHFEF